MISASVSLNASVAKNELYYLGHMVSKDGLRPSDDKVTAVKRLSSPRSVPQVQQFLARLLQFLPPVYPQILSYLAAALYDITRKKKNSNGANPNTQPLLP